MCRCKHIWRDGCYELEVRILLREKAEVLKETRISVYTESDLTAETICQGSQWVHSHPALCMALIPTSKRTSVHLVCTGTFVTKTVERS